MPSRPADPQGLSALDGGSPGDKPELGHERKLVVVHPAARVEAVDGDRLSMRGALKMHGQTHPVNFSSAWVPTVASEGVRG